MKALLLILVVAAGFGYYYFYYRAQPAATPPENTEAANPTPATSPPSDKRGFDDLIALLQQDMDGIPAPLDGPGRPPSNSSAIKRKVGGHVGEHPEYRTLVQACDLIIQADSQRAGLQQTCHAEQSRASFGASLSSGGAMDRATSTKGTPTPDPKIAQRAIHTRVESSWQAQRQQTATQVQQLLGSLSGKQL